MSWTDDVARRRWTYFLARRREFEKTAKSATRMSTVHASDQPPSEALHEIKPSSSAVSRHEEAIRQTMELRAPEPRQLADVQKASAVSGKMAPRCASTPSRIAHAVPLCDASLSHSFIPADLLNDTAGAAPFREAGSTDRRRAHLDGTSDIDEFGAVPRELLPPATQFQEEDPLVHAYLCKSDNCHVMCASLKRLIWHLCACAVRKQGYSCATCDWTDYLFAIHVRVCSSKNCPLPCCHTRKSSISSDL